MWKKITYRNPIWISFNSSMYIVIAAILNILIPQTRKKIECNKTIVNRDEYDFYVDMHLKSQLDPMYYFHTCGLSSDEWFDISVAIRHYEYDNRIWWCTLNELLAQQYYVSKNGGGWEHMWKYTIMCKYQIIKNMIENNSI